MAFSTFITGSLEEALSVLRRHEEETNSRFAVFTSSKNFGRSSTSIQLAKTVYWEDRHSVKVGRLEYSGVPFIILGSKTFDCQFGKNRKIRAKERRKDLETESDHDSYRKGKKSFSESKKLNCRARCVMREICKFPTYKVADNSTGEERRLAAQDLLCMLRAGENIPYERQIITCLPALSQHTGHPVGSGEVIPEPIDPRLVEKIKELVNDNITKPAAVKSQLCAFVRTICDPVPHPTNKRYYPSDKIIRNHIYSARNERLCNDQTRTATWSDLKKKAVCINKVHRRVGGRPVVQPLSGLQEKVMAALPACVDSGVEGEDTFSEQLAGCSTVTYVVESVEAEDMSGENMPGTSTSPSSKTTSKLTRLAQGKRKCTDDCLGNLLQVEKRKLAVLEEILDVQKSMLELKRLKYSTENFFS